MMSTPETFARSISTFVSLPSVFSGTTTGRVCSLPLLRITRAVWPFESFT